MHVDHPCNYPEIAGIFCPKHAEALYSKHEALCNLLVVIFLILFFCLYFRDFQCLICNKSSRPPRKHIRMSHTPNRKTAQILSSYKDGLKIKTPSVYWIPYERGKFYIGQIGRLSKRGARNTGDSYVCINMRIQQWQNTASLLVLHRLQWHLHISPNIRIRGSPFIGRNFSRSEQEYSRILLTEIEASLSKALSPITNRLKNLKARPSTAGT